MDSVPDMDDLLDQLEASEEVVMPSSCKQSTPKGSQPNISTSLFNMPTAQCKSGSTIDKQTIPAPPTPNSDQNALGRKDALPKIPKLMATLTTQTVAPEVLNSMTLHSKQIENERVLQTTQDATSNAFSDALKQLGLETVLNGVGDGANERVEDKNGTASLTKKVEQSDAQQCTEAKSTKRQDSATSNSRNIPCDLPEMDQRQAVVKDKKSDKFMEISLQRFNGQESHFEKACEKTANELDDMAREFEEMDNYLARCAIVTGASNENANADDEDKREDVMEPEPLVESREMTDVVEAVTPSEATSEKEEDSKGLDESPEQDESGMTNGTDTDTGADDVIEEEMKSLTVDAKVMNEGDQIATVDDENSGEGIQNITKEEELPEIASQDVVEEEKRSSDVLERTAPKENKPVGKQNEAEISEVEIVQEVAQDSPKDVELSPIPKERCKLEEESSKAEGTIVKKVEEERISQKDSSGLNEEVKEQDVVEEASCKKDTVIESRTDEVVNEDNHTGDEETATGGMEPVIESDRKEVENDGEGSKQEEVSANEVIETVYEQKDEQGEEVDEGSEMGGGSDEEGDEGCDIEKDVEETRGISVIASTHDIGSETDMTTLTESELLLGKVKPVWIADSDTASCMLCCAKFTLILRRHHCRSCGRVLCGQCTPHKVSLPYMEDPNKKFKVCEPCHQTMQRIEQYEKQLETRESGTEEMTGEPAPSTSTEQQPHHRMTKSVLKVKGEDEEGCEVVQKRSVTFRDGVNPGEGTTPVKELHPQNNAPEPGLIPKPKKKRASVVRRVRELRIEEENVCLLPKTASDDPLYTRTSEGVVERIDDTNETNRQLTDGQMVVIAVSRNFWCNVKICKLDCCGLGRVMCVSSCGMAAVGLDEIMVVHDLKEDETVTVPLDVIRRIREMYESSLKPQNDSFDEKMGIRIAHLRVPALHPALHKHELNEFAARDILLFRPSLQCLDNLLVPSSPFLVACFVHQCETLWAMAVPNRLLYRIGLQASYYPTPIVNSRCREPVFTPLSDTTVLKVFTDFRNWTYRMLMVHGSTVELHNNESRLVVPSWAKNDLKALVDSNRNMIAFLLDFNHNADSHLVCEQEPEGSYKTHVFTTGVSARQVTGATFIIIDGALKSGDVPLSVSVVEDGIAIRLRADAMNAFAEALSEGEDYFLESTSMRFSLQWRNNPPPTQSSSAQLVSPVDGSSLLGNYEYGVSESRMLSSLYTIPSCTDWALRLVAVYNSAKGRFAPLVQSKVFAVAEQITAQIAYSLVPFTDSLVSNDIREISLRIKVTSEDASYTAAKWANLEQEHATWTDLLDNQLVPGLFNICSFIPSGFEAELSMALISNRPLP